MSLTSMQRRHALASLLVLAAAGALSACNAIFGVDDLQFEPSTTGGGGSAGSSSSTGDASSSVSSSATGGGFGGGGTGGSGGAAGMGGTGGSGGVAPIGCSDGSRELFTSTALHPNIAGCSGAWSVQGLASAASQQPQCGRQAGNDGAIPNGNSCSVADLCESGWHVCVDKDDVSMHSTVGCTPFSVLAGIWIVRTGGPTNSNDCSAPGPNNLVGCGTSFDAAAANCSPLSRVVTYAPCSASSIWECGPSLYTSMETEHVTKSSSDDGGVLCCKDP